MKSFWFFGVIGLISGCGGETGVVSLKLGLSGEVPPSQALVPGVDRVPGVGGKDLAGTLFVVEEARLAVRDIEFDLPGDEDCDDFDPGDLPDPVTCDEEKVEISGPIVIDLVNETSTPSLEDVEIPAGSYRRIDVRLERIKSGSDLVPADDPLRDASLTAAGSFELDGPKTFDVALRFNLDARFEAEDGIEVSADTRAEIFARLDVDTWFSDLPISECIENGKLEVVEGHVTLDEKNDCHDFERTLRDAIRNSGRLHGN